jgi:multimeric flavodoxin WrbA
MEVVVLFGSPRRKGNTIELVNAMTETFRARGHHVRMLYLNDMHIRPCQGCLTCMEEGLCRINDDMKDIRKYMLEADLIVFATPVYWFTVSGQLKIVMDRSLAFMDKEYNSRIRGKKAVTIMTSGDGDPAVCAPALDTFRQTFNLLGLDYAGHVEGLGCGERGGVAQEDMERAGKLAETLA